MAFTSPELLWALFLLLIPILIHLFQFRKFQKEAFTNVELLRKIQVQTRKSNQLKKWLIFIIRMLALTALILAFAQPYITQNDTATNTPIETVIYLDNSFSMQANDNNEELLRKNIRELIEHLPQDKEITIFTNDKQFNTTTIAAIKDKLLALGYTSYQYPISTAILKGKAAFKNKNSSYHLIIVSDFQKQEPYFDIPKDSLTTLYLIPSLPQHTSNITIDSLYITENTPDHLTLTAALTRYGDHQITIPVSLYDQTRLVAKAPAIFKEQAKHTHVTFPVATSSFRYGKLTIEEENGLPFDNSLYFTVTPAEKSNILIINENKTNDAFLRHIYTDDEFNVASKTLSSFEYHTISHQHTIILNELKRIPSPLITALRSFKKQGGSLVIIPPEEIAHTTYNSFFKTLNFGTYGTEVTQQKKIITIAYDHPVFRNVFEKQVQNFSYPHVKHYYLFKGEVLPVLQLDNNDLFLAEKEKIYCFTAPLNAYNSNFINSPLIVPIFYNIGKNSRSLPQLYYHIGTPNNIAVKTTLPKDQVVTLNGAATAFIPQQQIFDTVVKLSTHKNPNTAGTYTITSKEQPIGYISYNYTRSESPVEYHTIDTLNHDIYRTSIAQLFPIIKNKTNSTPFWKWFVIFALTLLITEAFLLNLLK